MAGSAGSILEGLLGGDSFISQIFMWQVVGSLVTTMLQPYLNQAQYDVFAKTPNVQPPPPDLADWVVRGIMPESEAADIAAYSGENASHFHSRVLDTGEPPGLQFVLEAWRRGFIGWDDTAPDVPSVQRAIKTSRMYDYWADVIKESQYIPLSPADAVNAWVRQQIPEQQALQELNYNGINAERARILYNTTGRPPAPGQLAEFVRRALIPMHGTGPDALTFEQGILEGDLKDKWEHIFENLVLNIPGIFELRFMATGGGLDHQTFSKYMNMQGIPPDLQAAMLQAVSGTKLQGTKQLAQSIVEKLYTSAVISQQQAVTMLGDLGYSEQEADWILQVQQLSEEQKALTSAIDNVRGKYLAHHITRDQTSQILTTLGVDDAQRVYLLHTWDIELQAQVRVLTPAQIVDAAYYGIMPVDYAIQELQNQGYSPYHAWVVLSIKMKQAQAGEPAGYPLPPMPPNPPPGATGKA